MQVMKKFLIALLPIYCSLVIIHGEEAKPTIRIQPEEVIQNSIEKVRLSPSRFAVRWTYTQSGAERMLKFRRAQAGREVVTVIGGFESRGSIAPLNARPSGWTEEAWLKTRTDKIVGLSEDDADKIVAGLTKK